MMRAKTRAEIKLVRRGKIVRLSDFSPTLSLLDYLRLDVKATGTKEGCNEGDCGACTVALGRLVAGRLVYEPVNACIRLLGQIDGCELVTVEDLAQGELLHPVQQAMVEAHGSQCGFCTPGIIMALFTLYHQGEVPDRDKVLTQLAGNLCRCTGYRPIITAALHACDGVVNDQFAQRAAQTISLLKELDDEADIRLGDDERFFASPTQLSSLTALSSRFPEATVIAGASDVGLWLTKQLKPLRQIIYLGRVKELAHICETEQELRIGAGVSYQQALPALTRLAPASQEVLERIGGMQVRTVATVCGNIANGSPIGDGPPLLIALGARLELRYGAEQRELELEKFFIAYGKQDRKAGEIITRVVVPKLKADEVFYCYKLSKRRDQDISAVLAAFKFQLAGKKISAARLAYGGMAATPKRASHTEQALLGLALDDERAIDQALAKLTADFQPISDMRASQDYRLGAAQGLLRRALVAMSGKLAGEQNGA